MSDHLTASRPAAMRLSTDNLVEKKQPHLDALFATLQPLADGEIEGHWNGRFMAVTAIQRLPKPLARVLTWALGVAWNGKSFDGARGANHWISRNLAWLRYAYEIKDSPVDGESQVFLNYNQKENLRPLRHIRGEVRRLDANTLLARMNWHTRRKDFRVLYFTLYNRK